MSVRTITFRTPEDKVTALDSVAAIQQRDRSFVLNEAVDQYLALQEYHLELIKHGIRQDDAGDVLNHEDVKKTIASWSKKRRQ